MSEAGSPTKTPPGAVKVVRFHQDYLTDVERSVGTADTIWARETAAHRALNAYPQRQHQPPSQPPPTPTYQSNHQHEPQTRPQSKLKPQYQQHQQHQDQHQHRHRHRHQHQSQQHQSYQQLPPSEAQPLLGPRESSPTPGQLERDLVGSPFLRRHWDGAFYDQLEQENQSQSGAFYDQLEQENQSQSGAALPGLWRGDEVKPWQPDDHDAEDPGEVGQPRLTGAIAFTSGASPPSPSPSADFLSFPNTPTESPGIDPRAPAPRFHPKSPTTSMGPIIGRVDSKLSIGSNAEGAVYIDMLDGRHEVPMPGAEHVHRLDSIVSQVPRAPVDIITPPDGLSTFETLVNQCRTDFGARNQGEGPNIAGPVPHHSDEQSSRPSGHKHTFSLDLGELLSSEANGSRRLLEAWRVSGPPAGPIDNERSTVRHHQTPPAESIAAVPRASEGQSRGDSRSRGPGVEWGERDAQTGLPPQTRSGAPQMKPPGQQGQQQQQLPQQDQQQQQLPQQDQRQQQLPQQQQQQQQHHHHRERSMLEGISNNVRQAMRPLDPVGAAGEKGGDNEIMNAFEWDWKRPADEDLIIPPQSWIYLALIGFISFAMFYSVQMSSQFLDLGVFELSQMFGGIGMHGGIAVVVLCRSVFIAIAYLSIRILSPRFAGGSGIPEMKCVFNGVYLPQALSVTTLIAKVIGMIFCFSSGLSVGRLGPYVHVSCICAALVARIPGFSRLHSSPRHQMQALSAATAAGVSAALGAPIGGTLLSIELMSTYYYVHWLPMALYCATSGYMLAVSFLSVDEVPVLKTVGGADMHDQIIGRVLIFAVLGAICGKLGDLLIRFSIAVFKLRYRYFRSTSRGLLLVVVVTIMHNVIAYSAGGILWKSQKLGTVALLDPRPSLRMENWIATPFDAGAFRGPFSLFLFSILKFFLTGVSIVMPIPAGVFTCVFELGAGVGRLFGELLSTMAASTIVEPSVYAMVGAAAVTIGFVQAISVTVVMVELTGSRDVNLLPLAVGCLTAYIVSKHGNVDFFSAMIKLRRLPFILGLRETNSEERAWWRKNACGIPVTDFMNTRFPSVSPATTNQEALRIVSQGRWNSCALVSEHDGKLLGTVQRCALSKACGNAIRLASAHQNYSPASIRRAASERVSFLQDFDPVMGHPAVDPAPFQVSGATPFWKVATYFQMLGIPTVYITQQGTLVGQLSKSQFIEFNNSLNRRQELRSAASRGETEVTSIRGWNVPTVL